MAEVLIRSFDDLLSDRVIEWTTCGWGVHVFSHYFSLA